MATALSEFLKLVAPDVIGCPELLVTNAIRDAVIEFCRKSWVLRETFTVSVAADDVNTDLNDSVDIDVSTVRANVKPIAITQLRVNGAPFGVIYRRLVNDSGSPTPVVSSTVVYLGPQDTDGSWRIIRDGDNLAYQRRESGVWVTKSEATP